MLDLGEGGRKVAELAADLGANAIVDYVEIFHNRHRRHSSLEMRSPLEFENLNRPTSAA